MASLLKLADTKANTPGMNLMHYVVMVRGFSLATVFFHFYSSITKIFLMVFFFLNELWILFQQSQKADLALLEFPQELKHLEAASR